MKVTAQAEITMGGQDEQLPCHDIRYMKRPMLALFTHDSTEAIKDVANKPYISFFQPVKGLKQNVAY